MTEVDRLAEPLQSLAARLDASSPWTSSGGADWLSLDLHRLRELAKAMNEAKARFITITALELAEGEGASLDYHWDLNGRLLGFRIQAPAKQIDSIADLCEAADWIEREVHDGWAIEFLGREPEPLLLRQGDTAGINLRLEEK